MGSVLNFIVPDTNLYKKFGLDSSVIFHTIEHNKEIIKSYNFEIVDNAKNILLLETNLNLTFIYNQVDGEIEKRGFLDHPLNLFRDTNLIFRVFDEIPSKSFVKNTPCCK